MINFNEMKIADEIKTALLDMGFETPTPVQEAVIPLILDGKDVTAQAPTGTGKTCAFGIPIINGIERDSDSVQALILCPTRELVIQTENELKEVSKYLKWIKIISIYGGQNIDRQLSGLKKKPQIVVGTTGRVMDHLRRKSLKIDGLRLLILDEVDEMLNMGFREDIDVILETVPTLRQTVLFSATMPKEIVEISKRYQIDPVAIKTQHNASDIPNINQYFVRVSESEKVMALTAIIKEKGYNLSLVFCNTKRRVDELDSCLHGLGIKSDALHGDLRQHQRDRTMRKFRTGETNILIGTDVVARGIDVDDVEAVFNFDIPHDEEYYVHRIGRTARANKTGNAYTFVTDKQMYAIKNFEKVTNSIIEKAEFCKVSDDAINPKLFEKTLKLVKKSDLTSYKEFLINEIENFQQKYEDVGLIDFAAAMLLQLNQSQNGINVVLSQLPASGTKMKKASNNQKNNDETSGKGGKKRSGIVRYFINLGTLDKCDSFSLAKFISSNTDIPASEIVDINCLEKFSFANITEGFETQMNDLNGIKFGRRVVAVEPASNEKSKKPSSRKSDEKREYPKKSFDKKNRKTGFSPRKKSFRKQDF